MKDEGGKPVDVDYSYLLEYFSYLKRDKQFQGSSYSTDVKSAEAQLTLANATADNAWTTLPRDLPVDSVTHSTRFKVTTNANVSPNWTLTRFIGPNNSNIAFAQTQRVGEHTLTVVLGQPSATGGLGDEQSRQLLFQRLQQLQNISIPVVAGANF
jgi:hypothetical protein